MTLTAEVRKTVRTAYNYRCGYCGVPESWAGGELEIDHFCPLSRGGPDTLDNLVYACTSCNRFKSDYWPNDDASDSFKLLHPGRDTLETHVLEAATGRLVGLTPRGWFHIRWLHLNRPQLIEFRQLHQHDRILREALTQAEETKTNLQKRITELEAEVARLQNLIARLTQE
ncbi:MAG: HNH endonuclease [Candidatus Binatia bacterium]